LGIQDFDFAQISLHLLKPNHFCPNSTSILPKFHLNFAQILLHLLKPNHFCPNFTSILPKFHLNFAQISPQFCRYFAQISSKSNLISPKFTQIWQMLPKKILLRDGTAFPAPMTLL